MNVSFSYHITWQIPLNKTHIVTSFSLGVFHQSSAICKNVSSKTENHKGFFVNRTTLSRFLSNKVSRLHSLLKFQDFAILLASPNYCHGVSWVSTWLRLLVPTSDNLANMDCVTICLAVRSRKGNQDPFLWAWLDIPFFPKRYQFLHNTLSPVITFSAQYPKRYRKSSRCGRLEAKHPKGYQNLILHLKRYDEHSRDLYMRVCPPRPPLSLGAWTGNPNCSLLASCRQIFFSLCLREMEMETTVEPQLWATSLQRPLFSSRWMVTLVFNLSTTATSPERQQPLKHVPNAKNNLFTTTS